MEKFALSQSTLQVFCISVIRALSAKVLFLKGVITSRILAIRRRSLWIKSFFHSRNEIKAIA